MNNLSEIKKKLKLLKPVLESKYYITELGLFGSVVRNDFTADSDIDILVDFSQPVGIEFINLDDELELTLKRKVDLVSKKGIKAPYLDSIQSEIIYV
jgi:uncharacterized protein